MEEVKVSVFIDYMILLIENPMACAQTHLCMRAHTLTHTHTHTHTTLQELIKKFRVFLILFLQVCPLNTHITSLAVVFLFFFLFFSKPPSLSVQCLRLLRRHSPNLVFVSSMCHCINAIYSHGFNDSSYTKNAHFAPSLT